MKFKDNFKRFFTLDRHHDAGFTLVELIVVIAILAILAGIGVPAYSKYIGSANIAADNQVISIVNTSFIAAAAANEVSVAQLKGSTLPVTEAGVIGELTVNPAIVGDAKAAAIKNDFVATFPGGSFKTVKSALTSTENGFEQLGGSNGGSGSAKVEYDPVTGYYKLTTSTGKVVNIKEDDKNNFNLGIYSTGMKSDVLLDKVNDVTSFAADIMNSDEGGLIEKLFSAKAYEDSFYAALGVTGGTEEADALVDQMITQVGIKNGYTEAEINAAIAGNNDDLYSKLFNEIQANNAVLFAAQNTSSASGTIVGVLTGGNAQGEIFKNLTSDKSDENGLGMAQAALAYGLYTAYAERTEGVSVPEDPTEVLNNLNDPKFQAYLNGTTYTDKDGKQYDYTGNQSSSDLTSYLAAMNMVNQNATSDIAKDVLVNGFNTTDLNELLNGAKSAQK